MISRSGTHLLAVLVRDNRSLCRTRIGAEDDAVPEETTDDRSTRARRLGQLHAALLHERVSVRSSH